MRGSRSSGGLLVALVIGLVPTAAHLANPIQAHATSAYESAVLASSPSVYYRLGESSGSTVIDDSGNGVNGAYASSATLGAAGALAGDADTAVSFSGATRDGLTAAGTGLPDGHTARTMETWFKTTSTSSPTLMAYGGASSGTYDGLLIYLNGSSGVCADGSGAAVCATSSYALNDGAWHLVDAVYDGDVTVVLTIDGQRIGDGTLGTLSTVVPGAGLTLGGDLWNGDQVAGSFDEAAIYPSALSTATIVSHWRAALASACPSTPTDAYGRTVLADSPARLYRFDEASGNAMLDYSGNCMTGAYVPTGVTHAVSAGPMTDTASTFAASGRADARANPDGLPAGHAARTVETWFTTTTTGEPTLVNYGGNTTDPYQGFLVYLNGSSSVCGDAGGSAVCEPQPYALNDGHWHLVDVTYDGNVGIGVSIDGQSVGTGSLPGQLATVVPGWGMQVGGDYWNNDRVDGSLDETAVYPAALSADRIRAHYLASGHTPQPTGGAATYAQVKGDGLNPCMGCMIRQAGHPIATAYPVDPERGDFFHQFADLDIPGRGTPLAILRSYNSLDAPTNSPFGYGWSYNGGASLSLSGTSPHRIATVTQENGSQATFSEPSSGSTWAPTAPRFIAALVHNGTGSWTLTRQTRETLTFNTSGQITADTDLNGYTTTYSYTSGNLTSITDEAGRSITLNWTGSHITSVSDPNVSGMTRTVTYTYSTGGDLTDVTDVGGGVTHFDYDTSHRITVMKDPVCQAAGTSCPGVQNHYDGSGRIDWQKDQLNRETTFAYSGDPESEAGGATVVTDPKGNATLQGYEWGIRTYVTRGYGTAAAATTTYEYDPATLAPTGVLDADGHLSTTTVDSSGNVLTATDALGHTTTTTYNSLNEPLTVQDPKGVTTTMSYDGSGNLDTTSTPVSGSSCPCQVTTYNHADTSHPGDVTSMVDPDGKTWSYHYDPFGERDETKDPLGHVSAMVRNTIGWTTATYTPKAGCTWNSTPPAGCTSTYETTYSYVIAGTSTTDLFGQVRSITDPLSHTTAFGYDADQRQTTATDATGNTTTTVFDYAGQATSTQRADSTTTSTDYNADGSVLDQKDGKGNAILTYGYDSLGRVTTVTDALSNTTTYAYDGVGNVLTRQDPVTGATCTGSPKVGCTTSTYDDANRLTGVSYSDGTTPNVSAITYDADGQRTGMTDGTGSSTWTWDNLHRLASSTNGHGTTVGYGYNLRNLVSSLTYPGSHTVTRGYDDAGRLTSVADWLSTPNTTTFGYDSNSNLTSDTFQSGAADSYTFDAADQLTAISDAYGSANLFAATYTRDANGQLASDSSAPSSTGAYRYTGLNQLCYAGSASSSACSSPPSGAQAYGFDAADNLTTNNGTAQAFNAADELCWTVSGASSNTCASAPTGATTYSYDTRGNQTARVPSTGPATCNAWDQANRLMSVSTGTGSSCTTPTTLGSYAYDGTGLRMSKTVSGTTTQFAWDQSGGLPLPIDEQAGSGTPTYYLYGPGGLPVEQVDLSGGAHFYHHDQLGSTRAISSASGSVENTYTYDPYGGTSVSTGSVANPLEFSGEYRDSESGLYYLRARYYDAATAQFLSRDPAVGISGAPYGYTAGNPLNMADASGLDPYWEDPVATPFRLFGGGNAQANSLAKSLGYTGAEDLKRQTLGRGTSAATGDTDIYVEDGTSNVFVGPKNCPANLPDAVRNYVPDARNGGYASLRGRGGLNGDRPPQTRPGQGDEGDTSPSAGPPSPEPPTGGGGGGCIGDGGPIACAYFGPEFGPAAPLPEFAPGPIWVPA